MEQLRNLDAPLIKKAATISKNLEYLTVHLRLRH
jgi:hypothetical protein